MLNPYFISHQVQNILHSVCSLSSLRWIEWAKPKFTNTRSLIMQDTDNIGHVIRQITYSNHQISTSKVLVWHRVSMSLCVHKGWDNNECKTYEVWKAQWGLRVDRGRMMIADCGVDRTGKESLVCAASLKIHQRKMKASTKVNTTVMYNKCY